MLTDTDLTNPLTTQTAVFVALAQLAELHPDLPGAYITTSQITPTEAHVLLDTPADLEAWRLATHTDARDVQLANLKSDRQLLFTAPLGRITLRVYTVFAPAPAVVTA
ncbi:MULTISPECIES: hypothetical protein [unclassified Streptomyces]|uniref:hypothetical protein n=1 Tax=unclassified Streptomyces TaxID=2593676 RepID=UPI000DC7817B|nr:MULTISPECIES: hypothetical protein [unclassified Streptomyces]AWZ05144.1 hypothetical protein DRB89_11315 [Streptomyces sp. ICC4]AWZ11578.1 hypothetical protein DRB96_03785 [Streptomyces sp. ICC1]